MKAIQIAKICRFSLCLVISIVVFLHTAGQIKLPMVQRVENIAYDFRLRATLPNDKDERIVIIDIDEKSLLQEGRWPWSRNKLAYLVDILFDYYQINLLAFDMVFSEQDHSSGLQLLERLSHNSLRDNKAFLSTLDSMRSQLSYDDLLAQSFANRPIILGCFFSHIDDPISSLTVLPHAIANAESLPFSELFYQANSYGANLRKFQITVPSGGFFNIPTVGADGINRKVPLLLRYQNQIYEALSLAIFRQYIGSPPIEFITDDGYGDNKYGDRLEALQIQNFVIPVNDNAAIQIPYRGKKGSFNYISATDVLNAEAELKELKDKIVIVGTSAPGLFDLRSTPVQNIYPGVEIHANIVSGLLDRNIKSRPSFILALESLLVMISSVIVIYFFPKLSATKATLCFFAMIILLILSNIMLWTLLSIDSHFASLILFICMLYGIQLFFGYLFETRRKNKLGTLFGQYIPPELVEQMSHSPEEFSLKAENKNLSVLFSDVRGFTSISENLNPQELSELINEILTPITAVIHRYNGTIDKYIGDAVMAFWGAPLEDQQHAHNAVKAALSILPELECAQQHFNNKGWPHINIGIGINTGSMNVGNMGSEFRIAYTVMGDAVNLGSRLESLTKHYGTKIIVSEATKAAAPEFVYRELGRVLVKGKEKPIIIYEPLAIHGEINPRVLNNLNELNIAYHYYYSQQWQQASQQFTQLKQRNPEIPLYALYLQRIEHFKQFAPPADWNGVFEHTSK